MKAIDQHICPILTSVEQAASAVEQFVPFHTRWICVGTGLFPFWFWKPGLTNCGAQKTQCCVCDQLILTC